MLWNMHLTNIPQTLAEVLPSESRFSFTICKFGIFSQLPKEEETKLKRRLSRCYKHHGKVASSSVGMSLPLEVAGVFQLRMAMAWQRVNKGVT